MRLGPIKKSQLNLVESTVRAVEFILYSKSVNLVNQYRGNDQQMIRLITVKQLKTKFNQFEWKDVAKVAFRAQLKMLYPCFRL